MGPQQRATHYTASEWRLRALSPLDGRYGAQMEPYAATFSEGALIRERFAVEVAWLEHLAALPELTELDPLSDESRRPSRVGLRVSDKPRRRRSRRIEAITNHDVKAVEYYLKRRLMEDLGWPAERAEFVHFAATSEDVNNLAYAENGASGSHGRLVARRRGVGRRSPRGGLGLRRSTDARSDTRPAGHTHDRRQGAGRFRGPLGTPAASGPAPWKCLGKWGGATGTLAAHVVAYPELDWMAIARRLCRFDGLYLGTVDHPGRAPRLDG